MRRVTIVIDISTILEYFKLNVAANCAFKGLEGS